MAAIALEGAVKRYGAGPPAIDGLTLELADGELVAVVGPSGCGKSTVLRVVAGLEALDAGELRIGGARANDLPPRERGLAMVFQSYALYPHLSVFENLAFPLRIAGRLREDALRRRVEEAAATLELSDVLARRPGELSGGQRQRVAIGRAIVREARAFLFDEPLSNLDARLRGQMRAEIARLQRRLRATTLYVTHDQVEAMTLGDRVAVLRRGALQQAGPPRELYDRPANLFVAAFVGAPPMNLVPARAEEGALALPFARVPLPPEALRGLPAHAPLVAGIRPEHLVEAAAAPPEVRARGAAFRIAVDVTEWLGAGGLAHAPYEASAELTAAVRAVSREVGGELGRTELVAALGPESRVRAGAEAELLLDPRRLHLFDARTGARLGP